MNDDKITLRASASTGFKAPTPGQSNASNISTQLVGLVLTMWVYYFFRDPERVIIENDRIKS